MLPNVLWVEPEAHAFAQDIFSYPRGHLVTFGKVPHAYALGKHYTVDIKAAIKLPFTVLLFT